MNFQDIIPGHIRAIQPYKPGKPIEEVERSLGVKAIKLASNENPWGPSPKALNAVRKHLEAGNRYPEDTAFYLRTRLAEHYKVDVDEIIIGAGSSEILGMVFHALINHEDEVLTSEGSFVLYYWFAQIQAANLVALPLRDYGFDLAAMGENLSSKTRLVLLANPNNPTGKIIKRTDLDKFMKMVPDEALVIFDEAYVEYVQDPDFPDSIEYLNEGRSVLILRTFSKAYGLAGFRVGYGLGCPQLIEILNKVRPPFNAPSLAQVGALAAFDDEGHVSKCVKENGVERDFLASELEKRAIMNIPSEANFILLDLGLPAEEAFGRLMQMGVIVRPMHGAGFPTMIRVSVGTHEENKLFLKALDQIR